MVCTFTSEYCWTSRLNAENTCFVFPAQERHLCRLSECLRSIDFIYGNKFPKFLTNYNSSDPNIVLSHSKELNLEPLWGDNLEKSMSDLSYHIKVSELAQKIGFEFVFIIQNDMYIVRDFIPAYTDQLSNENWSFVSLFCNIDPSAEKITLREYLEHRSSSCRMAVPVFLASKSFVQRFINGEAFQISNKNHQVIDEELFNYLFFEELKGIGLEGNKMTQANWCGLSYRGDFVQSIINNKEVLFAHSVNTQKFLTSHIDYLLEEIRKLG